MIKKLVILLFTVLLPFGCVKEFAPEDYGKATSYLVVDALINDQDAKQIIRISKSSTVADSKYIHQPYCKVKVIDKYDNEFVFWEKNEAYEGVIDSTYFYVGNAFKVLITSPYGLEYESSFEEFTATSAIDSVYYELDDTQTEIQFYLGFQSNENYSSYYKWDIEETYEHHSTWPMGSYYTENEFEYPSYNYDLFVCYNTLPIKKIFTLSTQYINEDRQISMPLHKVDNSTQRLFYRYSLLVSQSSLTANAFEYWETLKKNNQEGGGLFDSQPSNTLGNLSCISDPEEKVLGFFGVSSKQSKRIFVQDVPDLIFPHYFQCDPEPIEITDILTSTETSWPIYFVPVPPGYPGYLTGDYDCFDCRENGGDTIPPDYWRGEKLIDVPEIQEYETTIYLDRY